MSDKLKIYRFNGDLAGEIPVESAVYTGGVMAENKITVSSVMTTPFQFMIGDYALMDSVKYSIHLVNDLPVEMRDRQRRFNYQFTLSGPEYGLYNKKLRHLNSGTFSFTGTLIEIAELIIGQAGPDWSVGDLDLTTEIKTINFDKDSIRTAVTKLAELFELEYSFNQDGSVNFIDQVGVLVDDVTFSYGKGNGLYNLTRQPVQDADFGTRFFGYGSSDNLPANYRDGATQLQFDGYSVDSSNIGDFPYPIETNVEFPDIKPERTGVLTGQSAVGSDQWSVTDISMDFDLNDVIVDGSAKIVFKTGPLAGNEFSITDYNNTTKEILFNVNQEDSGYVLPNVTVHPEIGDTYTFVGIAMPSSYVEDAEDRLFAATIEYAAENSIPKLAYGLNISEIFIRQNGLVGAYSYGDRIPVEDTDMGINVQLRIMQISFPYFNRSAITATISDIAVYSAIDKPKVTISKLTGVVKENTAAATKARDEADNAKAVAIRVKGKTNFLTTTIDGNVVATGVLLVGDASGNNNAGISGVTEPIPDDSVRFWAGDEYANRDNAPWRVLEDGSTVMTKATVASSETGEAIVIDSADNKMFWRDSMNDEILVIDGDVAVESIVGGVPVYGPGVVVKDPGISESTVSSRGFVTRTYDGVLETTVTNAGITTKGTLSVENVTNLDDLNITGILSVNGDPTVSYQQLDLLAGGGDFWRLTWKNGALIGAVNLGP